MGIRAEGPSCSAVRTLRTSGHLHRLVWDCLLKTVGHRGHQAPDLYQPPAHMTHFPRRVSLWVVTLKEPAGCFSVVESSVFAQRPAQSASMCVLSPFLVLTEPVWSMGFVWSTHRHTHNTHTHTWFWTEGGS
nr:unnamed protein product [Mus musculus]